MRLLVGHRFRFRRLDELMKHRQNGTAFPSAVILTLCAVEFDAADTETSDTAAASSRRRKLKPHKKYLYTPRGGDIPPPSVGGWI